ncbi:PAS domain S-box protein [Heliobacterium gestii]|uniref:histidine kinase n=1 Tax=Heliomicrobium gestii TaxID=2699 RepID=A0A845LGT7_HELGE|nr:MASE3 domain-containing protein [Heliomicrobium gestii]MBM7865984.1 PAS domain S-box-containing protein [Heliomicrobium gestii]MZP42683.1 PAS domain S-box protein [Heliomicrobium gestii]
MRQWVELLGEPIRTRALSKTMTMMKSRIDFAYMAVFVLAFLSTVALFPVWKSHHAAVHAFVELLCVLFSLSGFLITWILFEKGTPGSHLFGFGFLSIGLFTFFHIFAFLGLFSSPIDRHDLTVRYWIMERIVEAMVILSASEGISIRLNRWVWLSITLLGTLSISLALLAYPGLFPITFLEGQGSTPAKMLIELMITGLFLFCLILQLEQKPVKRSGYKRYVLLALLLALPVGLLSAGFMSMLSFDGLLIHILKVFYYALLFMGLFVNMITEPHRELSMASERFLKIFHSSPASISIVSIDGYRYIDVNGAWEKLTGYSREEVIGKSQRDFICLDQEIHRAIANRPVQNIMGVFTTKAGEIREGLITTEVTELDGVPCLIYATIDVTEKNKFERELSRLDRLDLVGQMAAGIGHEIRNPLTTVRGFLQLFGAKKGMEGYGEYFDLMISELDRANEIITEFLSLAKNKPKQVKIQDMNQIISSLHPLLMAQAFKRDQQLITELGNVAALALDEHEIRQLLLNLVNNAFDAMEKGGTVTIQTYSEGDQVILAVCDEGTGIAKEIQSQIGIPFFTTKDYGTGLGLATCYTIAERHHGRIDYQTGPEGTTFYVAFPSAEKRERTADEGDRSGESGYGAENSRMERAS